MEVNATDAWDHFLEAYGSIKNQRDSLIHLIFMCSDLLKESNMADEAQALNELFTRICNGEDFSNGITWNESQSSE